MFCGARIDLKTTTERKPPRSAIGKKLPLFPVSSSQWVAMPPGCAGALWMQRKREAVDLQSILLGPPRGNFRKALCYF